MYVCIMHVCNVHVIPHFPKTTVSPDLLPIASRKQPQGPGALVAMFLQGYVRTLGLLCVSFLLRLALLGHILHTYNKAPLARRQEHDVGPSCALCSLVQNAISKPGSPGMAFQLEPMKYNRIHRYWRLYSCSCDRQNLSPHFDISGRDDPCITMGC